MNKDATKKNRRRITACSFFMGFLDDFVALMLYNSKLCLFDTGYLHGERGKQNDK